MSGTIVEAFDSLLAATLIFEVEELAAQQRDYDGMGCDAGCGLCKPGDVCGWHHGARAIIPRRIAK